MVFCCGPRKMESHAQSIDEHASDDDTVAGKSYLVSRLSISVACRSPCLYFTEWTSVTRVGHRSSTLDVVLHAFFFLGEDVVATMS
ncbi:hypothetical protein Y032_0141g2253 [Ancylostoma ceylanicum]|uniref:Uncharacterized protein n=1 Tax=Ancylostoma ceylanicum TaxID=53326 RepID=A0A016T3Z6_9BILA|nr:hypothetical protein Y032_0141g2253 [Ancylostoma ceylanicum]